MDKATSQKWMLVIDDNDEQRRFYSLALRPVGADVVSFGSAREALHFLMDELSFPEMIVVDLIMPDMDGAEFIRNLRENKKLGSIPVILGSGVDGLAKKALEIGADGYLKKPMLPAQLHELWNRVTGG